LYNKNLNQILLTNLILSRSHRRTFVLSKLGDIRIYFDNPCTNPTYYELKVDGHAAVAVVVNKFPKSAASKPELGSNCNGWFGASAVPFSKNLKSNCWIPPLFLNLTGEKSGLPFSESKKSSSMEVGLKFRIGASISVGRKSWVFCIFDFYFWPTISLNFILILASSVSISVGPLSIISSALSWDRRYSPGIPYLL